APRRSRRAARGARGTARARSRAARPCSPARARTSPAPGRRPRRARAACGPRGARRAGAGAARRPTGAARARRRRSSILVDVAELLEDLQLRIVRLRRAVVRRAQAPVLDLARESLALRRALARQVAFLARIGREVVERGL